jgi:hypothetical protein
VLVPVKGVIRPQQEVRVHRGGMPAVEDLGGGSSSGPYIYHYEYTVSREERCRRGDLRVRFVVQFPTAVELGRRERQLIMAALRPKAKGGSPALEAGEEVQGGDAQEYEGGEGNDGEDGKGSNVGEGGWMEDLYGGEGGWMEDLYGPTEDANSAPSDDTGVSPGAGMFGADADSVWTTAREGGGSRGTEGVQRNPVRRRKCRL